MTYTSRWMVLLFLRGNWETRWKILSLGVGRLSFRCLRLAWEGSILAESRGLGSYMTQKLWYCDSFILFSTEERDQNILSLKVIERWTQTKATQTAQIQNQLQKHWWIWNSTRSCKHKPGKTQPTAKLLNCFSIFQYFPQDSFSTQLPLLFHFFP